MSVRESYARLRQAMDRLQGAVDLQEPILPEPPTEIAALEAGTQELLSALASIEQSLSSTLQPLEDLQSRLEDPDIVVELENRLRAQIDASADAVADALQDFTSLGDELAQAAADQLEDWLVGAVDALGDELSGAVDDVKQAAADGAKNLGESVKNAIAELGDGMKDRIEERSREAVKDVIEAATERALTEVAETIMTTQTGAMITSAIGPYLPAVIAIKPALPAIQDALDRMRGGF